MSKRAIRRYYAKKKQKEKFINTYIESIKIGIDSMNNLGYVQDNSKIFPKIWN